MGDEFLGVFGESELFNELVPCHGGEVMSLVGFGIIGNILVGVDEESSEAAFFEKAHEAGFEGFFGGGWDLVYLAGFDNI